MILSKSMSLIIVLDVSIGKEFIKQLDRHYKNNTYANSRITLYCEFLKGPGDICWRR